MLQKNKTKARVGILLGIPLIVAALSLERNENQTVRIRAFSSMLVGAVLFLWGCWNWCPGKGHLPAWGWLGLLWVLGLIFLALLPDHYPQGESQRDDDNQDDAPRRPTRVHRRSPRVMRDDDD